MMPLSHYWQLVRLSATGTTRTLDMPAAQTFLQQHFPHLFPQPPVDPATLPPQLIQFIRNPATSPQHRTQAELCLRCLISHHIEWVCIQLEMQFGNYYGFSRQDLLPLVLDDAGETRQPEPGQEPPYQPLALQILQSFDPERANLLTWTTRLVKQHREITAFLLQRGLCLISDWAILNETTQKKLRRVLGQFYQFTEAEIQAAAALLDSYHAVYRHDRLLQGKTGACATPTEAQLAAIGQRLPPTPSPLHPSVILARLQALAGRLRQYRIATRGGPPPSRPIDLPDRPSPLESFPTPSQDDGEQHQQAFLRQYRQQFLTCLELALEQVVRDRLQALKRPKQEPFLAALQRFHCQGQAMAEIAGAIGFNSYYQVCRLLKLGEFRADVRHWMLHHLQQAVTTLLQEHADLEHLNHLDHQLEAALSEQVDSLLQAEAANSKTPKSYQSSSVFARTLCRYLDRLLATPDPGLLNSTGRSDHA